LYPEHGGLTFAAFLACLVIVAGSMSIGVSRLTREIP
jgi:hypothetical protein